MLRALQHMESSPLCLSEPLLLMGRAGQDGSGVHKGAANKWLCLDRLDLAWDCAKLSQLTGFPPTGGFQLEMEFSLLLLAEIR